MAMHGAYIRKGRAEIAPPIYVHYRAAHWLGRYSNGRPSACKMTASWRSFVASSGRVELGNART